MDRLSRRLMYRAFETVADIHPKQFAAVLSLFHFVAGPMQRLFSAKSCIRSFKDQSLQAAVRSSKVMHLSSSTAVRVVEFGLIIW